MNATVAPVCRRALLRQLGLAIGGLTLAACVPAASAPPTTGASAAPTVQPGAGGGSLQKLRLVSWSQPRAEQANIFAAQELGYFRDEGLDLEYLPGNGSGDALKQLIGGNGDLAFVGPEALFFQADQGGDAVGVYDLYPHNMFVLASRPDAGVHAPEDLRGKKIGVLSLASGGRYNVLTVLYLHGLRESDVTLVATGPSPAAFIAGQVDVWSTIDSGLWLAQQDALGAVDRLRVRDYLDLPTDVLAVTRSLLDQQPDLVRRMLRPIKRATEFMLAERDRSADIGARWGLDVKDPARVRVVLDYFAAASESTGGLGAFDMDVLRQGAEAYHATGLVKQPIDVAALFTNQVVSSL